MKPLSDLPYRVAATVAGAALTAAAAVLACGPFFPNWLLGDERQVMLGPTARFAGEVAHFFPADPGSGRAPGRPRAVPPPAAEGHPADPYTQTAEIDDQEVADALREAALPADRQRALAAAYAQVRAALLRQDLALHPLDPDAAGAADAAGGSAAPASPGAPAAAGSGAAAALAVPAGLPAEIADYLEGALAYRAGRDGEARRAWGRLLARPAAERRHRSTWAAFMLGKLALRARPPAVDEAVGRFAAVRTLAAGGLSDRLGLAAASLGWEARAEVTRQRYDRALALYAEQARAGEPTAATSMRLTCRAAIHAGGKPLAAAAANADARTVLTSFVLAQPIESIFDEPNDHPAPLPAAVWLGAVRAAHFGGVPSGDRLAWAAYRAGDFAAAAAWLAHAEPTPVARWVRARLLLRDGKLGAGEALLAQVAAATRPAAPAAPGTGKPTAAGTDGSAAAAGARQGSPTPADGSRPGGATASAASTVQGGASIVEAGPSTAPDAGLLGNDPYLATSARALGEAGVAALSHGDMLAALDHLLRAGYWLDAAYLAERVLTVDELRAYVDRSWPAALAQRAGATAPARGAATPSHDATAPARDAATSSHDATAPARDAAASSRDSAAPEPAKEQRATWSAEDAQEAPPEPQLAVEIRYLLGRRLAREGRAAEAAPYMLGELRPALARWIAAGRDGDDAARPAAERAAALFRAACISRRQGLELLATEVEPDWKVFEGELAPDTIVDDRAARAKNPHLRPTAAETARAESQRVKPWKRFHYRYRAAAMARAAADLLPAGSDARAAILATAGQWLALRDPAAAQPFYEALVACCRNTDLGRAAVRLRWLPKADTCDADTAPPAAPAATR